MFGFLKDKLKGALGKLTKKVEEAPEEEITVEKEVAKKPKKEEKPKAEKKPQKKEVEKPAKKETAEKKESSVKKKEAPVEEREAPAIEGQKVAPAQEKVPEPRAVTEEPAPKQVAETPKVEPEPIKVEQKKGFFSRIFGGKEEPKAEVKAEVPVVTVEQKIERSKPEVKPEVKKVEPKKAETEIEAPAEEKGFFRRMTEKITTKKISPEQFDELFWDLELALLENNVALEVIEKIKADLKSAIVERPVPRGQVEETIVHALQESLSGLFIESPIDIVQKAKEKKPLVVCFVGVNGSGKTTSIAKMTKYLQSNGLSVVLAAADTFRAAAIDQLQLHADNLGVKLIRHDYGSDPAAVAFDAVKHAEAAKKDVVLIDTAGRLHSNINLVDEMKKIVRVAKPDLKIFVGESITGNDCVEQARKFDEAVGIDGIILAKADIDEKGGAAISVSFVTKKPILFLGMGQEYKDFQPFDKDKLLASLGL
ncbi:signal recognition particle-docking protein FtsY [Candidatus Woesearchaeota archaeon]|nr:MAG: signal recognition particle-docking protein FtsY [Candidatus Woesearchaeota archaeon]